MVRKYSTELVPGFGEHWQEDKPILLPVAVIAKLKADAAEAALAKKAVPAKKPSPVPVLGGKPLPKIRIGTEHDLSDAIAFAKKFLKDVPPPVLIPEQVSQDLLVAVVLALTYEHPDSAQHGMFDVLHYVVDPTWDSPMQVINYLDHVADGAAFSQPATSWFTRFYANFLALCKSESKGRALFKSANEHWTKALNKPKRKAAQAVSSVTPKPAIQVFCPEALEKAVATVSAIHDDQRGAAVRILEQARSHQGERTLPDAKLASKNLEVQKHQFENLVYPIEHMQTNLVLAAAMRAQDFRISPILLLGEPGIGKTYLASQLAEALGVPTEKISAGGAQGGFQLVGSHGAWKGAKPGMIAELLAGSASAAPVLVIDEVDKIKDAQYPFLPVLLDLLDAGTAKRFRDECLEIQFDASRIIVVLTANDISKVPAPLLSRVDVFTVPFPEPAQRLRIIQHTMAELVGKTDQHISLDACVAERLADRMDIDLRQLNRLVHWAFAKALQAGDKVARVRAPDYLGKITFNLRAWIPDDTMRI